MRVLLLNPPGPEGRGYIREGRCEQRLSSYGYRMVPISLPSTAGLLREDGHEVRIVDAVAPGVTPEELPGVLRAFDPALVVVAVSTPTYESDVASVARLRPATRAHWTAIGVHVTALPAETLRDAPLGSVVRGEPEWTTADLADALSRGRDLASVPGLSFRRGEDVFHNAPRDEPADLDALPPPARDLLREEDYFLPWGDRPYTLVIPTRGCPHHCTYCTAPSYYGKRLRRRTPSRVVDEMESIVRRGVVADIAMWSDTFTLDRGYVLELCEELERRALGVRWMCNSRVDCVDAELAAAMKRAGCVGISFGIESGAQELLDRVRKGTTVEQAREAVRVVKAAGIETLGHFMLGLPGETPETIRRTIALAKEADPHWAQFYCATPLPGTKLHEEATRSRSLPVLAEWREYEFNTPIVSTPELPGSALSRARTRAYAEFYLRPHVLRRIAARVDRKQARGFARRALTFAREWVLSS